MTDGTPGTSLTLRSSLDEFLGNVDVGAGIDGPVRVSVANIAAQIESINGLTGGVISIVDKDLSAPPVSPATGARYIVGPTATGAWATHEKDIAQWSGIDWTFTGPIGATVYIEDEESVYHYTGGTWIKIWDAQAVADAEAAQVGAETARGLAEVAQDGAEAAQLAAENARDGSFTNGNIYDDTAAGIAATSNGDQFGVIVGAEIWRYFNNSGVAEAIPDARYPTVAEFKKQARSMMRQRRLIQDQAIKASLTIEKIAAEEARSAIRLSRAAFANSTILYVDPSASGSADGSSWANAFTTLAAAFAVATPGCRIFTNASQAAPLAAESITGVLPDYVEIVTDQGADGETWVSGAKTASWAEDGGGIFSCTPSGTVYMAAYDLTRDTEDGAVSGVDWTTDENAEDLASRGISATDVSAWYGCLAQSSPATTTPAEGEWSVVSTTLYINPPGSPTLSEVNAGAIYANADSAWLFNKTGGSKHKGLVIRGRLITFFTPARVSGFGYGVKHTTAEDCIFQDIISILSGYHAVGATDNAGGNNHFKNCIAVQQTPYTSGVAQAFVFHQNIADLLNARHVCDDCTCVSIPPLNAAGAPVHTAFYPSFGLSHSGSGHFLGGIKYLNPFLRDFTSEVEANSGVTIATKLYQGVSASDTGQTFNIADSRTFSVKVFGGKFRGGVCWPQPWVEHIGVLFDRTGYSSNSLILNALSNYATAAYLRFVDCTLKTGLVRRCYGQIRATTNIDYLWFERSNILLQGTDNTNNPCFLQFLGDVTGQITFNDCVIDGATGNYQALVQVSGSYGASWANAYANIASNGGNIFGENLTEFFEGDGYPNPKDADWWIGGTITNSETDWVKALNPLA